MGSGGAEKTGYKKSRETVHFKYVFNLQLILENTLFS